MARATMSPFLLACQTQTAFDIGVSRRTICTSPPFLHITTSHRGGGRVFHMSPLSLNPAVHARSLPLSVLIRPGNEMRVRQVRTPAQLAVMRRARPASGHEIQVISGPFARAIAAYRSWGPGSRRSGFGRWKFILDARQSSMAAGHCHQQ